MCISIPVLIHTLYPALCRCARKICGDETTVDDGCGVQYQEHTVVIACYSSMHQCRSHCIVVINILEKRLVVRLLSMMVIFCREASQLIFVAAAYPHRVFVIVVDSYAGREHVC